MQQVHISEELLQAIANFANGDARNALSTLEMVVLNGDIDESGAVTVTRETLEQSDISPPASDGRCTLAYQ